MSSPISQFAYGVASGDPYASSVILWTRITPPASPADAIEVRWQVASSPDFSPGSLKGSGVFSTTAARDWTVKVEAAGLSADTPYFYRFLVGDAVSPVGQTKTLPVGSDPVRLAVFSCANYPAAERFDAYARAAAINTLQPYDAWVHLGDYIYEYGPGGYGSAEGASASRGFLPNREIISLDDYRQRYAQYHTDSGLQALRAAAPLIAIWDDHETANNSWEGGAENHQSASDGDWIIRRDAALKAYYEWMPIREPGQRQASDGASALTPLSQGYRSFNFGDVLALHVLETRLTARDQQLAYPDANAIQTRVAAILADPALIASYASKAGIAAPTGAAALPGFASALTPLVTQELVLATVQKAWGDPSRDLLGDTQMAWLQQRMASSNAAWQVLGQQVLMQSMALPAELLLNPGNPALLDKYAAPLQKLATGTPLASLSAAEQALFAEAGKIPYNLDAWDGYGVDRETILQTALSLGKRLISLAGDTHNAWAGVLDTMSASAQPAGTVAGVELATPGVTSPGLERYLPAADAYIRATYPAVDGLDGLFTGYINGLKYADTNHRGFLDLTVSKEQAVGAFQFIDGVNPLTGLPRWTSESVIATADFNLRPQPEVTPQINWQPGWKELDLIFGLALTNTGESLQLDPADFATLPRQGVQLADLTVFGSAAGDRIFAGIGSRVDGAGGEDELFTIDSFGSNLLVGGGGSDRFFLRPVNDTVVGGTLFEAAASLPLPPLTALADRERDTFLIDTSEPAPTTPLQILDFELGYDQLLIDGLAPTGDWATVRSQLEKLNVRINASPSLSSRPPTISLFPGEKQALELSSLASDADGDTLKLLRLSGPNWITLSGTTLTVAAPSNLNANALESVELVLAFSDGRALSDFRPLLQLVDKPVYTPGPTTTNDLNLGSTANGYGLKLADGVPIPVTYSGGNASTNNPGRGWSGYAATPTNTGYAFFWRNSGSQKVARWNLNARGVYESGYYLSGSLVALEEASLGLDLDGDGYTSGANTINGLNLGRTARGYALRSGSDAPVQVTYPAGDASASNPGNAWIAVTAAPSPNGTSLYWRNSISQQTALWQLDPSGVYQSGLLLSPSQLLTEEANLNFDLNADGAIAVSLGIAVSPDSTPQGYVLLRAGQSPLPVVYPGGNASPSNPGNGWSASAVAASGSGFSLFWRNNPTNQTARWTLNAAGVYESGELLTSDQLFAEEARLKRDLNADGFLAGPSTNNGLNLGTTAQGYALQTASGAIVQVSWSGGNASANNPGNGWTATSAAPSATGSTLYWSNSASQQLARWSLDASGAYQTGSFLSSDQLYSEETSLNADLNADSIIGPAFSPIESQGNTTLLRRNDGKAFVQVGGDRVAVASPFNLGTEDPSGEWLMLAAETVDGINQILWRNNVANYLHLWSLDAAWSWQSSSGSISPLSPAALGLEASFQVDLNRNGVIG
jgi:phosphodiesterase/alkaline phosphatase D-like protein